MKLHYFNKRIASRNKSDKNVDIKLWTKICIVCVSLFSSSNTILKRRRLPNTHKKISLRQEMKSLSSIFVNFSFTVEIKSWSDWLANVTMWNYEFVLLNDTHFVAIDTQLTRGLRGDSLRYLRSNVFFNVFYDIFGQTDGRGKWRKMTIIWRGCVAVPVCENRCQRFLSERKK